MTSGPRFGVFTFQVVPFADLVDDVLFAEDLGLDAVWLADQAVPPQLPVMEAWTTLAALAARTSRIRVGTNVTNVAMRNPMILARQALTVDRISDGRLDLGVGAGYFEGDHSSVGIDFLDGPGRIQRLAETVEILDHALRGDAVTYDGSHFTLRDAAAIPPPVQQPRAPLWIAGHAAASMRLAARLGDGAASFGDHGLTIEETLPKFRERMRRLDELCGELGRDPATLRRSYLAGFANEAVFSSRDSMADFVGRFTEAGATDFVFTFYNPVQPAMESGWRAGRYADRESLTMLLREVSPAV